MADKTYVWDEDFMEEDPNEDTGKVRYGGRYTNQTRQALQERMSDEHLWDLAEPAPQPLMGMHKEGSGISYYGTGEPSFRPDGVTALDLDDTGRLWADSGNDQLKVWIGTAWQNYSATGVGTILRWQSSTQYEEDEVVESTGYLWRANVALPAVGVDPDEPEWRLFEVGMPDDIIWIEKLTYIPGQLTFYAALFWLAVSPVKANPPGATPGEWTELKMGTVSIVDLAVTTAKIANLAVTNAKLGPDAVTNDKLADNAVQTENILDDAVTQAKIGPQAVGTDELQDGKVTTIKIADLNVTTAKIDDDAVTTVKIADLNVTTEKLEDAGVETVKIADANVTLAKLNNDTKDVLDWSATWQYAQNDIVNYNGVWYQGIVASPTLGVDPLTNIGTEWVFWTDMTTEDIDDTATIVANYRDHTVFADTSINTGYTITLTDGANQNDKVTIAVHGGGFVLIDGTGLTDQAQEGTTIEYLWSSTEWLPLGGGAAGGGGGVDIGGVYWLGTLGALPAGTLLCDGTLYDPADYPGLFIKLGIAWGGNGTTTFAVPDLRGIHPGAIGTQDINGRTKGDGAAVVGDYAEDKMQQITGTLVGDTASGGNGVFLSATGAFTVEDLTSNGANDTSGANHYKTASLDSADSLDARTGEYTDVSQAMGRWVIQAFEVNFQEIPADPSLIKDWVTLNYFDISDAQITYLNTTGAGKFLIEITKSDGSASKTISLDIDTESEGTIISSPNLLNSASNGIAIDYTVATSTFDFTALGSPGTWYFTAIKKFVDVAGADAQMNPPVDGWEEVFYDYANTADVTNSFGEGYFKFVLRDSTDTYYFTGTLHLNLDELDAGDVVRSANLSPSAAAYMRFEYDFDTNTFTITEDVSGTYYIAEIHKFNSLVNVVHSYQPDPRSVAQKDWVEVWSGDTADVTNIWGAGKYLFTYRESTTQYNGVLDITDTGLTYIIGGSSATPSRRIKYDPSANEFQTLNDADAFVSIKKWQDSQANDAPRNILEDGWELVYEDAENSSDVVNAWGTGYYKVTAGTNASALAQTFTFVIQLPNLSFSHQSATYMTNSDDGRRVKYDDGTNAFQIALVGAAGAGYIKQIWKFTGLLRISANYNYTSLTDIDGNNVKAINTDSGDVDAGLPTGENALLFEVWNTGTNDNHVIGLPNSIELGDGKGIRLRYVDGWKYEDVIIDEKTGTWSDGTYREVLYAGGFARIVLYKTTSSSGAKTYTYQTTLTSVEGGANAAISGGSRVCRFVAIGLTDCSMVLSNLSGADQPDAFVVSVEGRWKTGI